MTRPYICELRGRTAQPHPLTARISGFNTWLASHYHVIYSRASRSLRKKKNRTISISNFKLNSVSPWVKIARRLCRCWKRVRHVFISKFGVRRRRILTCATGVCGWVRRVFLTRRGDDRMSTDKSEFYQFLLKTRTDDWRCRERLGAKSASRSPGNPQARTVEGNPDILNKDVSLDPFEQGLLDFETGRQLLHIFRSRLIPYFPFVLFPMEISIEELNQEHPCACLAMLVAASFSDTSTQVALGNLFKQIVAVRMVEGDFNQLDLLQGLLIHVAWYVDLAREEQDCIR